MQGQTARQMMEDEDGEDTVAGAEDTEYGGIVWVRVKLPRTASVESPDPEDTIVGAEDVGYGGMVRERVGRTGVAEGSASMGGDDDGTVGERQMGRELRDHKRDELEDEENGGTEMLRGMDHRDQV